MPVDSYSCISLKKARHLEFRSPLSPEACAEQLSRTMDQDRSIWSFLYPRKSDFTGKIEPDSFYVRPSTTRVPVTQPIFQGRFIPDGAGTLITGTFNVTRYLYLFVPVIFSPILIMDIKAFSTGLPQDTFSLIGWIACNLALLLIVSSMIRYRYHRYFPTSDANSLKRFLMNTLDAEEVRAPENASS